GNHYLIGIYERIGHLVGSVVTDEHEAVVDKSVRQVAAPYDWDTRFNEIACADVGAECSHCDAPADVTECHPLPSGRDRASPRLDEGVGEQIGKWRRQARVAAFGLGVDGIEINEPRLEEYPRCLLQRLAHLSVQSDLVV